jgi:hypothetical protein
MFKVYVVRQKTGGSEVLKQTRTTTPSPAAAAAAWAYLYDQAYSPDHILLITQAGVKIAVHRYGSHPGDDNFAAREIDLQ